MKRANRTRNLYLEIGLVFLTLILFSFGLAFSQTQTPSKRQTDGNLLGVKSNAKSFSLLDPSKFRMSQSYKIGRASCRERV